MGPPLEDDIWIRRGISISWDADVLSQLCQPKQVISVRQLLQLQRAGWPEGDLPLVNDRTLIVAGLEGCIDALTPEEATDWLEHTMYGAVVSFQREVARGGQEAALVLWLAEKSRID